MKSITKLANRLAAAWEVFDYRVDPDKSELCKPSHKAIKDYNQRNDEGGLHAKIAALQANNIQEALLKIAVLGSSLQLAIMQVMNIEGQIQEAISEVMTYCEQEGIKVHPVTKSYYSKKA